MAILKNRGGGRSLRSTVHKVLSVGACSALLVGGALLVTASPASAAGTPAKIAYTSGPPSAATLGVAISNLSVSVEDSGSNVVTTGAGSTDSITISTSSAGCTLGGTDTVTASSGVATFSALTITAGTSCALTATDNTGADAGFTVTSGAIAVYPTTAAKLGFTSVLPTAAVSGGVLTPNIAVSVENGAGAVASNDLIDNISITSTCTLGGTTTEQASGGTATFNTLSIEVGTSCTLTASDLTNPPLIAVTSAAIPLSGGTPNKLAFTVQPPATVVQSAALTTFKVAVEDALGNVDLTGTGSTDEVAITSTTTGCTLGGTTTALAVAGVATFSAVEITSTGACSLTATDSSRTITTAVSTSVDSQGPQAALVVSSVTGYLGSPLTLTTTGGSGTGAVTFTATVGTAAGCVVTGSSLTVTSLGTCIVTATKAASTTNTAISSVATTVTFVIPGPKPIRVIGFVTAGETKVITISGLYFSGRPKVTSHAGTTAIVTKDTGKLLTVRVTVKAGSRNGTYVFTVTLANGKSGKVKYVQRA
jgi:hypothetical protein